ncbi:MULTISPECIES: class I SAM-dependent methyltransferase [Streptomyces]|uniref:Phosphatidylethanolamine N-methyltransferase /phosphatidyl-N-methylethanolamine N-methyltransferase n=1 Tax=Streptomyces yunnanensis TaxID=156453 RepID=A0A9X8MSJ5_9ACTN|nr:MULTISPECIES: class I SAM-dependent methyltransferase [Streptomyces]SHL63620.1 phosphatidylethanolamine N-methyltransferase /phosphatidyl-N-methylethanolamine N-methyltransferase [Streptomyces yunnanensis]
MTDVTVENERLRTLWKQYAPRYDRDMVRLERMLLDDGRAWVCGQVKGEVLEVAIGSGRNLEFYPAGISVTGLDLSPEMLELARKHAAALGREVELREGEAHAMPFPDGSFDTVVCTLGLCSVPDHRAVIAEMYRVLRPGGRLLLLDHVGSHHRLILLWQRLLEKSMLRQCGDHQTRRPFPLVKQAGFIIEHQERRKLGVVERVAARKPEA